MTIHAQLALSALTLRRSHSRSRTYASTLSHTVTHALVVHAYSIDSSTHRLIDSSPHRLIDSSTHRLIDSSTQGIMFDSTFGVLVTGSQVNEVPTGSLASYRRSFFWRPQWHAHVCDMANQSNGGHGKYHHQWGHDQGLITEELMPLQDYYSRHERGMFWVLEQLAPTSKTWFVRFLCGWALTPHLFPLFFDKLPEREEMQVVEQTLAVPLGAGAACVDHIAQVMGVSPMWICPLRNRRAQEHGQEEHRLIKLDSVNGFRYDVLVAIGTWGRAWGRGRRL